MSIATVNEALRPLFGLPFSSLGRVLNMLIVQVGFLRKSADVTATNLVGEWAIHVYCSWRIVRRGKIMLASKDWLWNPDGTPSENECGVETCFEVTAATLNKELERGCVCIRGVEADDVGGFSMVLDHDYRFDVFPDRSGGHDSAEYWRLFQPDADEMHFVVP